MVDRNLKIAVTGSSGFIGQYVLAELGKNQNDLVAVSRQKNHLSGLSKSVRIVELDINNLNENPYEMLGCPDVLIHLAWGGLPNYKSAHHFEKELPAQFLFLESLVRSGLKNLLVTGTCFEYGMQSGALSESMSTKPDNPYGLAKNCLRKQLECLKKEMPFILTWARLFYMYGDGQSENSLYSQLKTAISNDEMSFNMSGGEQLRDFMHVTDVARLLVVLATNGRDNGIVNICSGIPVSIRKLVEGWIEEKGVNISLNLGHYPYPDYEPMEFWGDPSKIKSLLDIA